MVCEDVIVWRAGMGVRSGAPRGWGVGIWIVCDRRGDAHKQAGTKTPWDRPRAYGRNDVVEPLARSWSRSVQAQKRLVNLACVWAMHAGGQAG